MATKAKKWSITTATCIRENYTSKAAVYRRVSELGELHKRGILRGDLTRVNVWVDEREGRGWQRYETVNLEEWSKMAELLEEK